MTVRPPILGQAPAEYERSFFDKVVSELRSYFERSNVPYPHNASTLNINLSTLATEADIATLRPGDVYRDTTASNVLKIIP
jgi:hypothetical protein